MKEILPKYISRISKSGKYQVKLRSKKYGTQKYVGQFNTINEAVLARDKFIVDNYHDFTAGILPRGITRINGKYSASFTFKNKDEFIGNFISLSDAVEARNKFIDSLK